MRGGSRFRRLVCGAPLALALVAAGTGCTAGPAAHHAADVAPAGPPGGSDDPPHDGNSAPPPPDDSPSPSEPPRPATPEGSVAVSGSFALEGLATPCCTTGLPGGDILVGDESGAIFRVTPEGGITAVGEIEGVTQDADHVLLGLAVDPHTADGVEEIFVYYARSEDSQIASYPYDAENLPGEQLTEYGDILVRDIPRAATNNGGILAFGPDGMLYAGTGDTAGAGSAADVAEYAGAILRLDPDTGDEPADNPDPDSIVYSRGHTDVQGLAWDDVGRLWAVDGNRLSAFTGIDALGEPGATAEWESVHTWGQSAAGLAFDEGSRSLWMVSAAEDGLWRVPLDGEGGLLPDAAPALLTDPGGEVAQPLDVLPGAAPGEVLALTGTGSLWQLSVT